MRIAKILKQKDGKRYKKSETELKMVDGSSLSPAKKRQIFNRENSMSESASTKQNGRFNSLQRLKLDKLSF